LKKLLALAVLCSQPAFADEGGVSFWRSGSFSSFAAVPVDPGWSLPLYYYHGSADATADKTSDLLFVAPTYTFAQPIMGGQATVSVAAAYGKANASSGSESDSRNGVSDLYPTFTLKHKDGVNNFLSYTMLGVPTGAYDRTRLANLGTNHWSIDGGGGYTYLNRDTGRELSAVLGFTFNFRNPDTDYRNGLSSHLDWAASQFLSPQFHAGLVGYVYYQLAGDSGAGATLGDYKSRVAAIGPQAGWFFNKWYVNVKGYYEFGAQNRPEGWNAWLTLSIPLDQKSSLK